MLKEEIKQFFMTAVENGNNLIDETKIDGNIIIPQTSEEPWYYVRYNEKWYSVKFEEFIFDFDNVEIEESICAKDYYEDYYLNQE